MAVYAICEKCGYQTRRERCPEPVAHKRFTTWVADVRFGSGKRIKEFFNSTLENPKELADRFALEKKTDYRRGKLNFLEKPDTLFGPLADKYWDEHARVEGRDPERSTYYTVQKAKGWIGVERKVSPLTDEELAAFQNDMRSLQRKLKGEGLAGATINRYFNIIRSIFERGREWGMVKINPLEFVSPVQINEPAVRFLEQKEIDKLFETAANLAQETKHKIGPARIERLLDFMTTIYHTGARPSSIAECNFDTDDVDFENRVIWFTTYKGAGRSSKKHRYPVPMDDVMLTLLMKRAEVTGRRGPVFDCTGIRELEVMAIEQSKINENKPENFKFTMYGLKHCYASHLLNRGATLDEIGALLGHTDGRMARKHYAKFMLEHLRKVQNKINQQPMPQLKVI